MKRKSTKTILITGVSSGIGYEILKLYSTTNNTVIAISRTKQVIRKLASEKINQKANLTFVQCNIASEQAHKIIKEALKANSIYKIDILINNAATLINKPFEETTWKDANNLFMVNYFSPAMLIKSLLPFFKQGTQIVNITSMGGLHGTQKFPGLSHYSASKAALNCLSECLATELQDRGIQVNALALGAVQTEMLNKAFPSYKAPVSACQMANFIISFIESSNEVINGKIISLAQTTP